LIIRGTFTISRHYASRGPPRQSRRLITTGVQGLPAAHVQSGFKPHADEEGNSRQKSPSGAAQTRNSMSTGRPQS
jgi:hypothetical protein